MNSDSEGRGRRKVSAHKKTRTGCLRCRRRRVKCDEGVPCGNCARRQETCDLTLPSSLRNGTTCPGCTVSLHPVPEWTREMYLMNYYTIKTAPTIIQISEVQDVFQTWIPHLALDQPQLMRILLSFAAFHLAFDRPYQADHWLPLALKHQTLASIAFRDFMHNDAEQNSGFWAVAAILGVTSLAQFATMRAVTQLQQGSSDVHATTPPIVDIVQSFSLLRGIGFLHQPFGGLNKDERLSPILSGFWILNVDKTSLPLSITHHFDDIYQLILSSQYNISEQEDLLQAYRCLLRIYTEVYCTNGTANHNPCVVWKWCSIVTNGYIDLLRDNNPAALVIFAHFTILSRIFRRTWFLGDWAGQSMNAIREALPATWTHWLQWPEQQLQTELTIFMSV